MEQFLEYIKMALDNIRAVSYTHLDVYKRQITMDKNAYPSHARSRFHCSAGTVSGIARTTAQAQIVNPVSSIT